MLFICRNYIQYCYYLKFFLWANRGLEILSWKIRNCFIMLDNFLAKIQPTFLIIPTAREWLDFEGVVRPDWISLGRQFSPSDWISNLKMRLCRPSAVKLSMKSHICCSGTAFCCAPATGYPSFNFFRTLVPTMVISMHFF